MTSSKILCCNVMGGGDTCKVSFNYNLAANLVSLQGGIE